MTSEALERCDALNWCLYQRAPRPRRTLSPSITLWKPAGDLIIITLSCPDSPDGLTPFECARFSRLSSRSGCPGRVGRHVLYPPLTARRRRKFLRF